MLARSGIAPALAGVDDLVAEVFIIWITAGDNDRVGTIFTAGDASLQRAVNARVSQLLAIGELGTFRVAGGFRHTRVAAPRQQPILLLSISQ
nr:hypothetical protein [Saccharomonospora marina]